MKGLFSRVIMVSILCLMFTPKVGGKIILGGGNSNICFMFTPNSWGNDPI